ncbi:30S ribosomal protein S3Ae [uncultured archaeon]|nr:30S ribosomal protein S3Ae [uncultured archaeon]
MALQKNVDKWKTKQWFDVYPPKGISTDIVGSIPSNDEKNVLGRIIKLNLSWVTNNPNHSFITVGFKVTDISGNSANTDINYLAQQYSYLHSFVKRRGDAIYTYDKVKDKDGKDVVLKLLVTTRSKIARRAKTDLRRAVSEFISGYVPKMSKEELLKAIIASAFQQEGIKKTSPIAPVTKFEIKKVEF